MTATLILHLESPLQAWGTAGAVATRRTHNLPQKSAILGMIRAAKGLKRIETWDELEALAFSVKVLRAYPISGATFRQTIKQHANSINAK